MSKPTPEVHISGTNWRGEEFYSRRIIPMELYFGTNEFHGDEQQWLLEAYDLDKGAIRTFAMASITKWLTVERAT